VVAELSHRGNGTISGVDNVGAAASDVVVVATPWDSAVETVSTVAEPLVDKVVISMVNALTRHRREVVPLLPPRGSMAAEIQATLPRSVVTGAFHHLPASLMEDLDSGLECDVLVVGDVASARRTTCEIADSVVGLRAVEVGSMALAGAIESFTAACITINIRHKSHSAIRLVGLED
jgi:8-hydroxy-5-deazaflavin:NADPH oxidoreductase